MHGPTNVKFDIIISALNLLGASHLCHQNIAHLCGS